MFLRAVKDGVKENAPVPSQVTSVNDKDREESSPVPPGNDHIDNHQTGKQTTTEQNNVQPTMLKELKLHFH